MKTSITMICKFRVQEMKDDLESTESAGMHLVLLVVAQAICWRVDMCRAMCAWP